MDSITITIEVNTVLHLVLIIDIDFLPTFHQIMIFISILEETQMKKN